MSPRAERAATDVLAVRYGTLASTKAGLFYRYAAYGEPDAPQALDYYLYAVRAGEEVTVIDTGFDPAVGVRRGRTCLRHPIEALAAAGVRAQDVARLVITHLHYDHIGNLDAFAAAEILVPERELAFWTGPAAARHQFAEHVEAGELARLLELHAAGRVRTYAGPCAVAPGIEAVAIGGHSPGQHALVVRTGGETIVLASDAVHLYEEIERDRPFAVVADLEAMYRGYDTLRSLSAAPSATLVPGHDPEVAERFPAVDGAFRLTTGVRSPA